VIAYRVLVFVRYVAEFWGKNTDIWVFFPVHADHAELSYFPTATEVKEGETHNTYLEKKRKDRQNGR